MLLTNQKSDFLQLREILHLHTRIKLQALLRLFTDNGAIFPYFICSINVLKILIFKRLVSHFNFTPIQTSFFSNLIIDLISNLCFEFVLRSVGIEFYFFGYWQLDLAKKAKCLGMMYPNNQQHQLQQTKLLKCKALASRQMNVHRIKIRCKISFSSSANIGKSSSSCLPKRMHMLNVLHCANSSEDAGFFDDMK